jgi:uncharacterized membrane protein
MPPVHPAIIHFPIALVVFSFVADWLGYFRRSDSLRAAAFWSLVAAFLGATVAVATGYSDMWRAHFGAG